MAVVKLQNVRLFFPSLFEAQEYKGKRNYRAKFGIEPGSAMDKQVWAAINETASEKWGKKGAAKVEEFKHVKQQFPYIDGAKADFEGAEGLWILTGTKKEDSGRPLVIDRDRSPLAAGDDHAPYSGCYVNASVEIWAQDGENSGIRCQLRGVQFFRDGEGFGGGSKASVDEFDDLGEGADADDLGL